MKKINKIIWQKEALVHLKSIRKYISKDSKIAARKVVKKVRASVNRLKTDPLIGQEEDSLWKYQIGHRYLVVGNYKVIFRGENNHVFIIAVFDTRRNPSSLKKIIGKG